MAAARCESVTLTRLAFSLSERHTDQSCRSSGVAPTPTVCRCDQNPADCAPSLECQSTMSATELSMTACFYCGGNAVRRAEMDHFPVPKALGGTETVRACQACHDLKDRLRLVDWPLEVFAQAWGELNEVAEAGGFLGLVLAKLLAVAMREEARKRGGAA
jgi:hypothetical protein